MAGQNINLEGIQRYSESFAKTALAEVKQVDGAQLLKFSPIEQVNLLMAKNLYLNWEEEVEQLKSPCFNYQADEVQVALKNLMNVLSQNILIEKENLKPLLAQSVDQLLVLAADPRTYFLEYFLPPEKENISKAYLEKIQKFVKINHQVLTKLLDKLQENGKNEITRTDYTDRIKIITAELKDSFDPLSNICQQLSQISPISEAEIFMGEVEGLASPPADKQNAPKAEEAEVISINQQFSEEKTSLNQRLKSEPKKTLANLHLNQKVKNLKQSLTLNQQFMFVKELFAGDETIFTQALEQLESCDNYDEATDFLKRTYSEKNQWNMESDAVKNFFGMLSRRY